MQLVLCEILKLYLQILDQTETRVHPGRRTQLTETGALYDIFRECQISGV